MKKDWKSKLTPFDTELAIMVESVTGKPCELKNGGTHFYFHVDYENHIGDPDYLLAVWDAIEGRIGKRCISMKDDAENHVFIVRVKFSEVQYPGMVRLNKDRRGDASAGDLYTTKADEYNDILALKVTRGNAERLLQFVGNGEMEMPDGEPCVFHFLNAGGSVYAHAPENSFVVYISPERFEIVEQEKFERDYVK